jgi:hypothetical protein
MSSVPMREDCRHFQSRTYSTGEVARFCTLDLAPEAPWRCPADCSRYQPDLMESGFVVGSLVRPPVEDEPDEPPADIAALLDNAEDIVNAVAPDIARQVQAEDRRQPWWKWWRRRHGGDDGGFHLSDR